MGKVVLGGVAEKTVCGSACVLGGGGWGFGWREGEGGRWCFRSEGGFWFQGLGGFFFFCFLFLGSRIVVFGKGFFWTKRGDLLALNLEKMIHLPFPPPPGAGIWEKGGEISVRGMYMR